MSCYVLIRTDLKFHTISIDCPGSNRGTRILYGQPTLCGLATPTEQTDILQYSGSRTLVGNKFTCQECIKVLNKNNGVLSGIAQKHGSESGLTPDATRV